MTNATKAALEASLKKLLLKKPLDKITINDLTTDCGISRMAFYYHFKDIYDLLYGVVQEKAKGTGISEADQSFIADFYKYSFTGVMLDWIKDGMKVDYHMIAEKMHRTMEGNVVNSIRNFEKRNKI